MQREPSRHLEGCTRRRSRGELVFLAQINSSDLLAGKMYSPIPSMGIPAAIHFLTYGTMPRLNLA